MFSVGHKRRRVLPESDDEDQSSHGQNNNNVREMDSRFMLSVRNMRNVFQRKYDVDHNKPREEISYTEFHPDLDPRKPLALIPISSKDQNEDRMPPKLQQFLHGENASMGSDHFMASVVPENKPFFQKVSPFKPSENDNYVNDESMINAGYQHSDFYCRPAEYIRSVLDSNTRSLEGQPILGQGTHTSGLDFKVEYDMDEQDDEYLSMLNQHRAEHLSAPPITREIFELAISKLELEWYELERKMLPRKHEMQAKMADDNQESDVDCAVCNSGECENSNAIVFCDGCNVAVHQDCYGVPFIPEGQWLCRRCLVVPKQPVSCLFCPNKNGAFKQTDSNHWAHLVCALWIPEVTIGNAVYMEPIQHIDRIPRGRWKLHCYICRKRMGACIQCNSRSCFTAFHPTCAKRAKLMMNCPGGTLGALHDPSKMEAWCERHSPEYWNDENGTEQALKEARTYYDNLDTSELDEYANEETHEALPKLKLRLPSLSQLSNSNGAAQIKPRPVTTEWKTRSGAPIIPHKLYKALCETLRHLGVKRKKSFASQLCQYWTLKRKKKRGAALIKRLQLALELSAENKPLGDIQLFKKLLFSKELKKDLLRVRELLRLVQKREEVRYELAKAQVRIADILYFPTFVVLQPILRKLFELDTNHAFSCHAQEESESISLESIKDKLHDDGYQTVDEFQEDVAKMCSQIDKDHDRSLKSLREKMMTICNQMCKQAKADLATIKRDPETDLPDFHNFQPHGLQISDYESDRTIALRGMSPLTEMDDDEFHQLEKNASV